MLTTHIGPVPAISYLISCGGAQRPRPTMENEQFVQKLYTPSCYSKTDIIVDPKNKFTFYEIYVSIYDYGIFNRFT